MSHIAKLINSISSVNKEKKYMLVEDIIAILSNDLDDSVLPLLFNLSQSTSIDDRHCAAKILYSIQDSFCIKFVPTDNLNLSFTSTYLESSGKKYNKKSKDYELQKQWIKSKLDLDLHSLVEDADFTVKELRKENIKDSDELIEVTGEPSFYKAIECNLLSSDWAKRHAAFLFLLALFYKNLSNNSFFKNLFTRKTSQKTRFNYNVTPLLINICLEILKEDKFSDFINDQTIAPVRECASLLLSHLIDFSTKLDEIFYKIYELIEMEDWQEQLSGLLVLKYLDPKYVCCHHQNFNKNLTNFSFCNKLDDLILCSQDEDIKYLSALIKQNLQCSVPQQILQSVLSNTHDISLSTAALINLLRDINDLVIPLTQSLFRHPLKEVRLAIIRLILRSFKHNGSVFTNDSDNFYRNILLNIINNILVEEDNSLVEDNLEILLLIFKPTYTDLIYKHICLPFYKREENCYDELYYSINGVKQLGSTFVKNKLRLIIPLINHFNKVECNNNLFCLLINYTFNHICSTDLFTKQELKKLTKKEIFHPKIREKYQEYLLIEAIKHKTEALLDLVDYFREYYFTTIINHCGLSLNNPILNDLVLFCFNNKIKELFIVLNKMNIVIFYEYFLNNLPLLSEVIEFIDKREEVFSKCLEEAYKLINSDELINTKNKEEINDDELYDKLINDNLSIKKTNTSKNIKQRKIIDNLMPSKNDSSENFNFLYKIISFYIKDDIKYSDLLINKLLKQFNSHLLGNVFESLDTSYYILFVRKILHSSCYDLLSKILPYLCITKDIPSEYTNNIREERELMNDLVSNTCREYVIKCPMNIKLRSYQVEGVNWIAFLCKYGLKGILGDDMGLGKTIQVLTFLCSEIYVKNNSVENGSKNKPYDALILCPSTLISHWLTEIKNYFPFITDEIKIMSYEQIKRSNEVYSVSYLILDEGHLLRNKETILYNKVSLIKSEFTLILSGTPIQNNSLDLVNLMNLMMKGYLNKSMDLTTLHSKTLPLILRRLKSEVLEELPDKVISDVVVEMSQLQKSIYEVDDSTIKLGEEKGFKRIQSMIKICNNPLEYLRQHYNSTNTIDLINKVLSEGTEGDSINVKKSKIIKDTNQSNANINEYTLLTDETTNDLELIHNPKLVALIDLLKIIKEESKILLFCQYKSTIDLIQPYLSDSIRLDGSTKEKENVIQQFINKHRILIMTTTVGGLGLNLACADTVIFYEHDWNPFNDLQAMDRAHRIGQKNTVNVFRLIMKDTIEEKIMNYQQFKVFLANKLVNYENQSVKSMNIKDIIENIVEEQKNEETEDEDFIY